MNSFPSPAKRSLRRYFLPFVLLFSLGLHGMILLVPTAPGEDEWVAPPDPEEDGITVTKTAPPTSQRATSNPEPSSAANTSQRVNQSARAATPNGNLTQTSGSVSARAASGGLQSSNGSNRSAVSRNETSPTPTANQRNRSLQNASTTGSRASSSPVVPPLSNPNPSPAVPSSRAVEGRRQFLSYADLFATYRGVNPLTPEAVAERRSLWLSSFTDQGDPYTDLEIQPLAEFELIPYGAKICLPSAPDPAELLVLVEADGTVNSDIMTLQSTGYRQFNEAAQAIVEQHKYPSTDLPKAYAVQVRVDYGQERCQWPPMGTNLPDDYFEVLESYIGPTSTTLSEARKNQAEWLNAMVRDEVIANATFPEENILEDFPERVAYPNNICLPIEPAEARWGMVVSADGSIQGEPQPLRSTGYAVFDDRAKALVEDFEFPTTATPQAYVVVVQTAYNGVNCQPLTSQTFELTMSHVNRYARAHVDRLLWST
ncbi:MAG: hypothetical protein AAGD09_00490 [Cyanobacteria bacterium P01_F01_bin.56]